MNFIVVHRSVWLLLPTNQYDWLYSCSCSPRRSQLLSGLSELLQQEPSHLRNSVCIHIKAICHLLLDYDSQHGITPEEQEKESSMNDHTYKSTTNLFGIQMNDSIGVLAKQRDGSVKCIPCSSSQCEHVMLVKQWPMDDPDIPELLVDFLEQDVATGYSGNSLISPVSSRKIPFDLFGCQRRSFQNGPECVLPEVMDDEGKMFLALFPPFPALNDEPCQLCGNNFRDEDPRDKESWYIKSVKLYGKRKIFDCLVYKRPCSGENCVNDMKFDGYAYTVLNMGNYLISYEVLREYMFLFLKGGVSMNTYYQSWALSLESSLNINLNDTLKYNHWRSAWYAFLQLLDIDFTDGFECPTCKSDPEIIICDGTSLAYRKNLCSTLHIPSTTTTAQSGHGSRHSNRVFVKSKDTRKSLKRVCTDVSAIDINELNALQSELHQSIPSLANFLDWCLAIYGNEAAFPIGISKFIKNISCNTPICAILPLDEELRRVCDKIKRSVPVKEFPSDMELLQRKCPALFGIFSSLSDSFAPAEFIPLLTDLLNIADNAFKDREAPQDDSVVNPSSLLANFPSLKPVRGRGTYAADKGKQTFENPCTKKSGRHPTLLPGIFLIFCQHGINYGYSVMTTNESPDMPFTILRSRFTRGNTVNV